MFISPDRSQSFTFRRCLHGRTHPGNMRGMAVRKFHGACPPPGVVGDGVTHGRKRFHHFQIHVGVRFGSDDAYRPRAAKETCGFGRRFHSGGKPDALDRPAGKAFQSFQAQRQVRATFGARDGVHFIHDNGINGGKYPSRLGGEQQEQRFWRGYEDIRRMADDSAPFLRRGVAASYAHADFRRWQSHRLALSGDAGQWRLEVLGHIHAQSLQWRNIQDLDAADGFAFLGIAIGFSRAVPTAGRPQ